MTNLLRGVVLRGTGAAANALDWPLAGKTGTVDDYTDAWFIGFDPNVTVGVWLGRDEKKPIGPNETGTLAALPMWIEFMKSYIELRGNREQPPTFDPPGNIVFMAVDRNSGEPVADGQGRLPRRSCPVPSRSARCGKRGRSYSSSSAAGAPSVPVAFCIK